MRIGMITLFMFLYIAIISLFILGYRKHQKKVWILSLVLLVLAIIFTIIIVSKYA